MMTKVAGRVADGFVSHSFQTADYLREVTLPALEAGLAERGRSRERHRDLDADVRGERHHRGRGRPSARRARRKQQIAFYGSTPAYKPVLDHHGWGDAQPELNRMSKEGEWVEMADVIDDEMLVALRDRRRTRRQSPRSSGIASAASSTACSSRPSGDPEVWGPVVEEIRAI